MFGKVECTTRVECQDYSYSEIVEASDDALPGEFLVEHGRKMGHTLRVVYPEE